MVIKARTFIIKVVRANDGRVPASVAAAKPSLVNHRHIGDAMFFCQIVGGPKAMPTGTYDDDVIFAFQLSVRPLRLNVFIA